MAQNEQTPEERSTLLLYVQTGSHTHTRLTALFRDYPGEPVPER